MPYEKSSIYVQQSTIDQWEYDMVAFAVTVKYALRWPFNVKECWVLCWVSSGFYCIMYLLNLCSLFLFIILITFYTQVSCGIIKCWSHSPYMRSALCKCVLRECVCVLHTPTYVHEASVCALLSQDPDCVQHYRIWGENNRIMKKSPQARIHSSCDCFHTFQPKETGRMQILLPGKHTSLAKTLCRLTQSNSRCKHIVSVM